MGTDELHEHAAECKGHVGHQPVLVAAEIEDDSIVAHENRQCSQTGALSRPDLPNAMLQQSRATRGWGPLRAGDVPRIPSTSDGQHLHGQAISCHQYGDNCGPGKMATTP